MGRAIWPPLVAACLLQACAATPATPARWTVAPVFEVRDARYPVAPATAAPAVPAPLPAAAARPQARMELVKIGDNEYRLQAIEAYATSVAVAGDGRHGTGLQIVNGNGRRGQARQLKRLVEKLGIGQATLLNQRHFRQRTTVIDYLAGREDEARAVAALLPARIVLHAVARLPGKTAMRLVLGHDLADGSPVRIAAVP